MSLPIPVTIAAYRPLALIRERLVAAGSFTDLIETAFAVATPEERQSIHTALLDALNDVERHIAERDLPRFRALREIAEAGTRCPTGALRAWARQVVLCRPIVASDHELIWEGAINTLANRQADEWRSLLTDVLQTASMRAEIDRVFSPPAEEAPPAPTLTSIVPVADAPVSADPTCPHCRQRWHAVHPIFRSSGSATGRRVRVGATCRWCGTAIRVISGAPVAVLPPENTFRCIDCRQRRYGEAAPVTSESTADSGCEIGPDDLVCIHCYVESTRTANDGSQIYWRHIRDGMPSSQWRSSRSPCLRCGATAVLVNGGVCPACHGTPLHSYGFKPQPRFIGNAAGPFFGIELEMGMARRRFDRIRDSFRELDHVFYAKSDSSIGSRYPWTDTEEVERMHDMTAVEMVSHPLTLAAWEDFMATKFGPWLDAERAAGSRSWSSGSCGLHVHTTKLPSDREYRLRRLLASDGMWTWRVSGRHSQAHLREYSITDLHSGGRNVALNTSNAATTEFRLWCGTLNKTGVLGTIQLTAAMCEWAQTPPDTSATLLDSFLRWFEERTPHYQAAAILTTEKAGYLARATE